MWLLIYNNDHIAWLLVRMLVRLSMENVFFSVWRSLVNDSLQNLLLLNHFLSIAVLALVGLVDLLARPSAVCAWACTLGVHAWTNHRHLSSHAATFATSAC